MSDKPARVVNQAEMKSLVNKAKYVYVLLQSDRYSCTFVPVDRSKFVDHVCRSAEYDYQFVIDENYEDSIYVDKITRTLKQQAGETGDTPGVKLVP